MVERIHAAFWNLENLFAPEGFAGRPEWLQKRIARDLKGWTQQLFNRKIQQLAVGISAMNNGAGPDILGVCEVENRFCLDELVTSLSSLLPDRNYDVLHADAERDHRGIDTAFLFDRGRVGVVDGEFFSHWVMRRTGTRDISQATFRLPGGSELVALCNHWPSRLGDANRSAGFRATAGETLGYFHERIREEKGSNVAVIAFGDFNDDPFDPSITVNANATREIGDVRRGRSAKFLNLSWRYLEQQTVDHRGETRLINGTLYYGGDANLFDQILVSKGLLLRGAPLRCLPETARIELFPAMVDHRVSNGPIRFGLPKGNAARNIDRNGFSDHFPVSVVIEARD